MVVSGVRRLAAAAAGVVVAISLPLAAGAAADTGLDQEVRAGDAVVAAPEPECTITGTPAADLLRGTPGTDVICGLGGDDVIRGGGGDDLLIGGAGRDRVFGGTGDDALDGGARRDQLVGGPGADTCLVSGGDLASRDCAVDATGPVISDVQVPAQVAAGTQVTVTWRVSDPSGVAGTYLSLGGRQGWASWCFGKEARLVSGDDRDGTYSVTCAVPTNVINDTFGIRLGAHDALGNGAWPEADSAGFTTTGGSDDLDAPVLSDVTFADSARPGTALTVTFRLQDETGVGFASLILRQPVPTVINWGGDLQRISGDERDGTYSLTLEIPDDAALGTYEAWLWFGDPVNNRSVVTIGSVEVG